MIFGFSKDKPRPPLWMAFAPLAVGLAVYGGFWQRESTALRADVEKFFTSAGPVEMGGFPYRLSASMASPEITRTTGELYWHFLGDQVEINRQPWRRHLNIARAQNVKLEVTADAWPDAMMHIESQQMLSSLHVENHVLQRFSGVFQRAFVKLPFLPLPLLSDNFELHLRETPTTAKAAGNSPTAPDQAQLRILGPVQIDSKGETVQMDADVGLTQDAPLQSVSQWRKGGTIEVRALSLRDAKGFAFLTLNATLAPLPDGRIAVAGTYSTSCPRTVAALFIGMPSPQEYRTRRPQKYAINGFAGRPLDVAPVVEGFTGGPARNREPACPVLRR